jgi:hypothetical protein
MRMDKELKMEKEPNTQVDVAKTPDVAPTLLGAVAGTVTSDAEVLTGHAPYNYACDFQTDWAHTH